MSKKYVKNYLQEGMYGTRLPKESERKKYLGTLRERVAFVLTVGDVMSDRGLDELECQLKKHPKANLLLNGNISYRFLKKEKELAGRFSISHTTVSNPKNDTEIGLVLTSPYAIEIDHIYLKDMVFTSKKEEELAEQSKGIVSKFKNLFD